MHKLPFMLLLCTDVSSLSMKPRESTVDLQYYVYVIKDKNIVH